MVTEPNKEHQWLNQLVGEWSYEHPAHPHPDRTDQPETATGTESARSIGGLWVMLEGSGEMPCGGGPATTMMTLGYDPQRQKFVGTWIGSMMTNLWVYEGELDAEGKVLTLEAEGPDFEVEGKIGKYRDIIELKSPDHRVMTSLALGENGEWNLFNTVHYKRTN